MELVGELEPTIAQGPIVPGQFADLAVHGDYAYLNSWDEPSCTKGGTYIADISDPANPVEAGFIPAVDGYYHGEGAHVVSIDTPQFTGDLLAVNNEACSNDANRPPGVDAASGGFDLYDVSDPSTPVTLIQNAGDNQAALPANSYHSVFVWQDGNEAFLVASDNTEFEDVDIFDITDPTAPLQIKDLDISVDFPQVLDELANGDLFFHHDVVVKEIGGVMRMLVSYWDAGYVQLNVDDPANPTYITDTNFDDPDPLTGFDPPEGNAHQAEYSHNNEFILAGDEDFSAFRATNTITEAPFDGVKFAAAVSAAEPIPDGTTIAGDTVFVGSACTGTVAPPPAGVTIAVAERGVCAGGFQEKIDAIEAAGYELAVIFNNSFGAGGGRCESLVNMLVDGPSVDIPAIFVGRADGLRILGTFDQGTYQCTGAAAETPADTDPPAVGAGGLTISLASDFDGWGFAHLYDAQTSEEIDAFAIPESLDPANASGFGDLSIHEFAADPDENLAYASYYTGGMRVFMFGRDIGLAPTGAYIDPDGSNFWGVEQFTTAAGQRLIAGSDRDFGLQIFRYTGPHPATGGGGGGGGEYGEKDPPQTKITKKPKKKSTKRKAKFKFTSDEANSTFQCRLDKKSFKACSPPYKKKVKRGKHKFRVRAIDPAGNVDPTPAKYSWKVKKKKKG